MAGHSGHRVAGATLSYREWIEAEAKKIGTDNCTLAADWHVWCCWEHDLACHYGKDPKVAYRFYQDNSTDYWNEACYLYRRAADKRFTACNLKLSKGFLDISRSLLRYLGVRLGALLPPY